MSEKIDGKTAQGQRPMSLRNLIDALQTIAAQSSGVPASTARADCMAAIASAALRNHFAQDAAIAALKEKQ